MDMFKYFTVYNTVMVTVIKRQKAHFRIDIRDIKTGKVRTLSLTNHEKKTVDQIKEMIIECLESKAEKT